MSEDLNAFIDEVVSLSRNVSDKEKKAYADSYPVVANMLTSAMKNNPSVAEAHIAISNLLLEYKYYVSWKLFNPEKHKTLQLPLDSARETAIQ